MNASEVGQLHTTSRIDTLSGMLRREASMCPTPLYQDLLEHAATEVANRGFLLDLLLGATGGVIPESIGGRLLAGVHSLVLEGSAPDLARFYPSVGGSGTSGAWPHFIKTVKEESDRITPFLTHPVQTNEVGRCSALMGGFLFLYAKYELGLRLFELGASAGLNLRWDSYRYETNEFGWGPPDSPLKLSDAFASPPPFFCDAAPVVLRRGCDLHPIDPVSPEGSAALRAYVLPDQTERLRQLDAALKIATSVPLTIDCDDASRWIRHQVTPLPGTTSVIFHSLVWPHLPEPERPVLESEIAHIGEAADERSPVAWLRMEPTSGPAAITLTTWPGGNEQLLATSDYYGKEVQWIAPRPPLMRPNLA